MDGWQNFYVIVGSAAGALIGLQFVVLTLVADKPTPWLAHGVPAFGSPTIVHFSAVLFLSAVWSVPWRGLHVLAAVWGVTGVCGVVYVAIVARRMRKQVGYEPLLEDWVFHVALPVVAYAAVALSWMPALSLHYFSVAFFGVGGAALLLLFVGIHNAWDSISYHVVVHRGAEGEKQQEKKTL